MIPIEQPPSTTASELAEYLQRMMILIDIALNNKKLNTYNVLPNKPIIATIYYFNQAIAGDPVITEEGAYIYTSTGYKAL